MLTIQDVYFTKTANSNYYGATTATVNWTTYLKNVIPNEWVVSYYASYPTYLQAGTMASKMYAWWYIINPKWNYAPYYADVKDNSSDQNFLYSSYSSLTSTYQRYVDNVVAYVKNLAMCSEVGNMFEVHYHATSGTQYSGTLSASGALTLAQSGYSTIQILGYYYNYASAYIGSSHYIQFYSW